jgi:two-component system OmpR family response regulator
MRILVVEDNIETAATLKKKLEAECYAVDVEGNGERASYRARTNAYDLIVLDNVLPGKHGDEICRELRDYHMPVPILILSAQTELAQKIDLLNCGADDYLTKPFSYNELGARIKALLRRPAQIETPALTMGSLTLDRGTFSARRGDRAIRLTPKEFAILELFMKHPGKVLTRGAILEHVWDDSADPFSNSIETHITNLRKKIGPRNARPHIKTVPGHGYMLE